MSLVTKDKSKVLEVQVASAIKKFLRVTNVHIDLTINSFVFRESSHYKYILDVGYRGTSEDDDHEKAVTHLLHVFHNDAGQLDLICDNGFRLIEGYNGFGPEARVVGNSAENKRRYLAAVVELLTDISGISEAHGIGISEIICNGDPYRSYSLEQIKETGTGKAFIYKDAYGYNNSFD